MISCIILDANANFETKQSIFGTFGSTLSQTSVYRRPNVLISTISWVMEHVHVPGTVSGRLRSSVPHMRSVRMDDMIRQRHLRDGFLKTQGTSTFAIVNPECPIRRDKVTNHSHVRGIQYRTTSDSWRF